MVLRHWSPSKGSHSLEGGMEEGDKWVLTYPKQKIIDEDAHPEIAALQKEAIADYSYKIIQESPKIHRKQKQTKCLV